MKAINFVIGADQDLADFVDSASIVDVDYLTATDIVDSADTDSQVGGVAVLTDNAKVNTDGFWHIVSFQDGDIQHDMLPSGWDWDSDDNRMIQL